MDADSFPSSLPKGALGDAGKRRDFEVTNWFCEIKDHRTVEVVTVVFRDYQDASAVGVRVPRVSVEMGGEKDPVVIRRTWFEANWMVVIIFFATFRTGGRTGTRCDCPIFHLEIPLTRDGDDPVRDGRFIQCTVPYALLRDIIHLRTCVFPRSQDFKFESVTQRVTSSWSACHVYSLHSLHLHDVPHFHSHIRMTLHITKVTIIKITTAALHSGKKSMTAWLQTHLLKGKQRTSCFPE